MRGRKGSSRLLMVPPAILAALAAAAVAAASASATVIQTGGGVPYTGPLNGALSPGTKAVFTVPGAAPGVVNTITCDESTAAGQISNAGSFGTPAIGNISGILWEVVGGAACPNDIPNASDVAFQALLLPWSARTDWVSDNTAGTRNGTDTLSGVRMVTSFTTLLGPLTCQFSGDLGNANPGIDPPTRVAQGDLFNPDNTLSGKTEMRFVNEPFTKVSGESIFCPFTATMTATYVMVGQGGGEIQIREGDPPADPPPNPPADPPPTPVPDASVAPTVPTGQGATRGKCRKRKAKSAAARNAAGPTAAEAKCKKKRK